MKLFNSKKKYFQVLSATLLPTQEELFNPLSTPRLSSSLLITICTTEEYLYIVNLEFTKETSVAFTVNNKLSVTANYM